MENRFAVGLDTLVADARVPVEEQVTEQAAARDHELPWRGPVPPYGDGGGGGCAGGDGD